MDTDESAPMDTDESAPLDFEDELKVIDFLRFSRFNEQKLPEIGSAFESLQAAIDEAFGIQRTVFTHCGLLDYRSFVGSLPLLCLGIRAETAAGAEITAFFAGDFTDIIASKFQDPSFWTTALSSFARLSGLGIDTDFQVTSSGLKPSELPPMKDGAVVFGKYLVAVGEESWMYLLVSQSWIHGSKQPERTASVKNLSSQDWIGGLEAWGTRYVYAGKSLGDDFWNHPEGSVLHVVIGGSWLSVQTVEQIRNGTRIPVSALHLFPSVAVHAESGEITAECEVICAGNAWSMRVLKTGIPAFRYLDPPEGMIGMMVSIGTTRVNSSVKQGSTLPLLDGYRGEAVFSNGLFLPGRFISDGESGWFEVSMSG